MYKSRPFSRNLRNYKDIATEFSTSKFKGNTLLSSSIINSLYQADFTSSNNVKDKIGEIRNTYPYFDIQSANFGMAEQIYSTNNPLSNDFGSIIEKYKKDDIADNISNIVTGGKIKVDNSTTKPKGRPVGRPRKPYTPKPSRPVGRPRKRI